MQHLWAPLLEKALAKSFGSYKELGKSSPFFIMQRLTGGLTEYLRWAPAIHGTFQQSSPASLEHSAHGRSKNALESSLKSLVQQFGRRSISKDAYLRQRNALLGYHGVHSRVTMMHRHQDDMWEMVSKHLEGGSVLGASCRSSHDHEDTGEVSRDHMFSIVASKSVQGVRFLGLRNRWGKTSWNSFNALLHLQQEESFREVRWLEAHMALHLEAALALRRFIGMELTVDVMRSKWHVTAKALVFQKWRVLKQQDPTAFWISMHAFTTTFNTLYILFENHRTFPVLTVKGQWMRKCVLAAGGCTAGGAWPLSSKWLLNPKFQLHVLTNKTRVRISLSCTNFNSRQPSVAFKIPQESSAEPPISSETLVVVAVLKESVLHRKGPNIDFTDFVFVSRPCNPRTRGQTVLPELILSADATPYVIVPMLLEQDMEGTFRMDVCASEPCFLRGHAYAEHPIRALPKLTSMPTEIRPDPDSDWEDSHQKDDPPQEAPSFDLTAWGSLAQTSKVTLHPRLAAVLYKEDIADMMPSFRGKTSVWHQRGETALGGWQGGVEGWEDSAKDGATKAKVRRLLLRYGFHGLDRLSAVQQELMGMIEVRRSPEEFCITENRVVLNCADPETGTRSISARLSAFGQSGDMSIVGELCYCDPLHADSKLTNMRGLRGKIACIPHGGSSSLQEKALRAFHAGVIAVILINDADELYAISGDDKVVFDKSSNVMALVESRDVSNDLFTISLQKTGDMFSVSRKSLIGIADLAIPVVMIGKTDGEWLRNGCKEAQTLRQPSKNMESEDMNAEEEAKSNIAKGETPEERARERAKERRRLDDLEKAKELSAKRASQVETRVAADKSNVVSIVSDRCQLLSMKADLALESRDPLLVNRIVLNCVGLSVNQFKGAIETVFISLQFYHYKDIRDVPVAVEPVAAGESSSGVYRLSSIDARFRNPNRDEGGVHISFDLDPFNTGMEQDARNDLLASYLLSQNLEISIWARTASGFFPLGTATLPLFVLLRQQRECVLFHGSLPIRETHRSARSSARNTLVAESDTSDNALHIRAVNVGLHPRSAGALVASGPLKKSRILSLMPKTGSSVHRAEQREVLGITVPDHEILQLARKGQFYDSEAPLDRRNLPFSVEFRDLDGENAAHMSVLDLTDVEVKVKSIIKDLSLMLYNSQIHGSPYPFPKLADFCQASLIHDHMWIAFTYKEDTYRARILQQGTTIEYKGEHFQFESFDKCVWDIIGEKTQNDTDIGLAQLFCYSGTNQDNARSLASICSEYNQQRVVGQLNRWIPFFRNECLSKESPPDSKTKSRSKPKQSKSKQLSRLEANVWLAMGVCAFMHWPLEHDIKVRKALRSGAAHDAIRQQQAEWTAIVKATKYLARAADAGHACARYNLGLLFEAGFASAEDKASANDWLTVIAAQRHSEKLTLADFNKNATPRPEPKENTLETMQVGCGSPIDLARAQDLYSQAAEQGLECAKCMLGLRMLRRIYSDLDIDGAMKLLSSCSQKEAAAMFGMGILYVFHVAQDLSNAEQCRSRAYECFRQASEQGHRRASFNAGMCKKLGIGTPQDDSYARYFFRNGARRLDVRCIEQLAISHLEANFPHSHPSTGVGMLQDAWKLGHRAVASKLAEIYSKGGVVCKNHKLAGAWLAQVDHESDQSQLATSSRHARGSGIGTPTNIALSKAVGMVQLHEALVKETIETNLQKGDRSWRLGDVLVALVEKASLDYALASDAITAISLHYLKEQSDLDKPLQGDAVKTVFPFMSDDQQQKDWFQGQSQLKQLYGPNSLMTRRLQVISTALFKQISCNFNTTEEAFLQYCRPENRSHVLVNLAITGVSQGQCDERWQHRFSRFLERLMQVGLVLYESRKLDIITLEQEYRLFRQGKPHMLFLFDDNDFDKKRGFGTPRMRGIIKGPRNLKAKPSLYSWQDKTLEGVQDPDTRLTTYQNNSHPLSVPSLANASALGESNQKHFDRSVACGVLTEVVSETPLPPIEEYSEKILDDLQWARAHLRYGGNLVIPAPDIDPAEQLAAEAEGKKQTVKHGLGRLLPLKYKEALQNELDDLVMKACTDSLLERDLSGWLPNGSPFRQDSSQTQVCCVDILSQHEEYRNGALAMVLKMQMVTKNVLEAQVVAQRLSLMVSSGVLSRCARTHCMPDTGPARQAMDTDAFGVHLRDKLNIMTPSFESNMQRPFVDQPIRLNLLSLPSFMKMLAALQICGVCDAGCKEKHFGKKCSSCESEYFEHDGHMCPNGGQGIFEVDRLPHLSDAKCILFALAGRALSVPGFETSAIIRPDSNDQLPPSETLGAATAATEDGGAAAESAGAAPADVAADSPVDTTDPPPPSASQDESAEASATVASESSASDPASTTSPDVEKQKQELGENGKNAPAAPAASTTPAEDSSRSSSAASLPADSSTTGLPASPAKSSPASATESQPKSALADASVSKKAATVTAPSVAAAEAVGADDEESRAAAAKAAKLSAKRRRFMHAQAVQHQRLESNKENSHRPTGDIHGVDCRQFSSFFQVFMDVEERPQASGETQMVRANPGMSLQEPGLISRMRALREIQQFQRKNIMDLNRVVIEDITNVKHWFPCSWHPTSRFFKHNLKNPYSCDVEVIVSVSGNDFDLLTNTEEHAHCCTVFLNARTDNAPIPRRVQRIESDEQNYFPYRAEVQAVDRVDRDMRQFSVTIRKGRTVSIFFKYAGAPGIGLPGVLWQLPVSVGPLLETSIRAAQTQSWTKSKVSFHCREILLEILNLDIRPQPMIPSRTFRIYLGEGESRSGLLPLERHEVGKLVKVFSQTAGPLSVSAEVMSRAKCEANNNDRILSFAYVDSGAWLTHQSIKHDIADPVTYGALRLHFDASECQEQSLHHTFLSIFDGLSNLIATWSVHVIVLKTWTVPESSNAPLVIPVEEFARDVMGDLPSDPKNWQYLVSRFSGIEDGERTDVLQISDSIRKDAVSFKLKETQIFQSRQCQIRLIDRRDGQCYRSLRIVQYAKGISRVLSWKGGIAQVDRKEADELYDKVSMSSSDDDGLSSDEEGAEKSILEPETEGEIYFYLLVDSVWMRSHMAKSKEARKKTDTKIRINASEVLREDLRKIEELVRVVGDDETVRPTLI